MNSQTKNLNKRRNYRELRSLQRTLDDFFNDWGWPTRTDEWLGKFQPQSKLVENHDNYYVEVDLPGINKKEIEVKVEDNVLKIRGERKEKKQSENSKQHYSEIFYGSFAEDISLPTAVDSENIKARYEDGVLFITIPKSEKVKGRQIEIE